MQISQAVTEQDIRTCLDLRHTVFVEEQGVPVELEIDENNWSDACHFLGRVKGEPAAAARSCVFDDRAKIQRVVVLEPYRGLKLGRALMEHLMDFVRQENLAPIIALDAQTCVIKFYQSLGFIPVGDEFDDAGSAHVHMVQTAV